MIVLVGAFSSIGEASTKNRCRTGQEQTGCVLKTAYYLGHSGSAVGKVNTANDGFFIIHDGGDGVCLADSFEVRQKLKVGTLYTFHDDRGQGHVSGSLKVAAKKGTMVLTTTNPNFAPGTAHPGCSKTVTIPLTRERS